MGHRELLHSGDRPCFKGLASGPVEVVIQAAPEMLEGVRSCSLFSRAICPTAFSSIRASRPTFALNCGVNLRIASPIQHLESILRNTYLGFDISQEAHWNRDEPEIERNIRTRGFLLVNLDRDEVFSVQQGIGRDYEIVITVLVS